MTPTKLSNRYEIAGERSRTFPGRWGLKLAKKKGHGNARVAVAASSPISFTISGSRERRTGPPLGFLDTDAIDILPLESADLPRMRELMRKYRDLPMDLADAALMRVAERERTSRIFTIDRKDFELYRLKGA